MSVIIGAGIGVIVFCVTGFVFALIDHEVWLKNFREFGKYNEERPTVVGSGFYMAYKNMQRKRQ